MKIKAITLPLTVLCLGALTGCSSSKTKIGILQFGSFEALEKAKEGFIAAFEDAGKKGDFDFVVKNAAANMADNTSMAATLAADSDLVYGIATPSASALKNAVDSISSPAPVIFSAVTDAVGAKLLKDEKAPEGNCTGVLDIGPIAEELDWLTKFEGVDKIASFYTSSEANSVLQVNIAKEWLDEHGIAHVEKSITNAAEISSAFAAIPSDVDAVFLPTDDTIANAISQIKTANEARPDPLIIVGSDTGMIDGCTFALGVDYFACGKQAGNIALSILVDKKAIKNIPVERCDVSNIFVNETWATALGQSIPAELLNKAGVVKK